MRISVSKKKRKKMWGPAEFHDAHNFSVLLYYTQHHSTGVLLCGLCVRHDIVLYYYNALVMTTRLRNKLRDEETEEKENLQNLYKEILHLPYAAL